jgi:DNA-binding NarL/FixJ family response regulator
MVARLLIFVQEGSFADALATRLAAEQDLEVVAALSMRAPSPQQFTGSPANVVLLDCDLSADAAFRLCQELSQRGDTPHVVFLSHSSNPGRIARAIAADSSGQI